MSIIWLSICWIHQSDLPQKMFIWYLISWTVAMFLQLANLYLQLFVLNSICYFSETAGWFDLRWIESCWSSPRVQNGLGWKVGIHREAQAAELDFSNRDLFICLKWSHPPNLGLGRLFISDVGFVGGFMENSNGIAHKAKAPQSSSWSWEWPSIWTTSAMHLCRDIIFVLHCCHNSHIDKTYERGRKNIAEPPGWRWEKTCTSHTARPSEHRSNPFLDSLLEKWPIVTWRKPAYRLDVVMVTAVAVFVVASVALAAVVVLIVVVKCCILQQ